MGVGGRLGVVRPVKAPVAQVVFHRHGGGEVQLALLKEHYVVQVVPGALQAARLVGVEALDVEGAHPQAGLPPAPGEKTKFI